ncbi:hypothetical protein RSAG8_11459, partial [Rhizoctonia solani AG-8 WAC10335]
MIADSTQFRGKLRKCLVRNCVWYSCGPSPIPVKPLCTGYKLGKNPRSQTTVGDMASSNQRTKA